jgi:DNA-binding response OmpR family regulator
MNRSPLILVVDDEPNVRLVVRTALEAEGYGVVEARDGEEALARLRDRRFDLILLDLRLPVLDGMGTLRRLRESGDDTPVVIVTAHGSVPDAVAAIKLGAIDFLAKPMTPEALRGVVADVVGRHSAAPAGPPPEVQATAAEPEPEAGAAESANRFAEALTGAKRALNRREFDKAEFFLDRALALDPRSNEAGRLKGLLRDSRREHQGPYRVLRDLFPVGLPRRAPWRPRED